MRNQNKLLVLSALLLSACSKEVELEKLDFDASVEKATFPVTESARFNFKGNPNLITFYSGEPGSRYEFRNRTSDTSSNVQLRFSTATTTATNGTLSLLVSNSLSGVVDSAKVVGGSWTDITNRATLATGTATVASGAISLADFAQQGKPVYIAFRYTAAAGAIQRRWTITGLTLNHILTDRSYTIADMTAAAPSPGWLPFNVKNTTVNWTNAFVITGANTAAAAAETEDWMVAGPIDLRRVFPDVGVPIKTIVENMSKFPFVYKYGAAGTYSATFVATNANTGGSESTVKTIPVTVQ